MFRADAGFAKPQIYEALKAARKMHNSIRPRPTTVWDATSWNFDAASGKTKPQPVVWYGSASEAAGHDFERDQPPEHGIAGLVHDAHTAAPDQIKDFVFADLRRKKHGDLWRRLGLNLSNASIVRRVASGASSTSPRSIVMVVPESVYPG